MLRKYTTKSRIYQKNRKKRRRFSVLVMLFFAIIIILCANKAGEKISDKINEIRYPVKFSSYIIKYSDKNDLDPYLVMGLIRQESNFVPDARSKYAGGLMQLTQTTAHEYGEKLGLKNYNYMDPETNIQIGCYVLASLIDKYENVDTALAAYNAGVGNVDSWLKNPDYSSDNKTLYYIPFSETRHYVEKVNKYKEVYKKQINENK